MLMKLKFQPPLFLSPSLFSYYYKKILAHIAVLFMACIISFKLFNILNNCKLAISALKRVAPLGEGALGSFLAIDVTPTAQFRNENDESPF